MKCIQASTLTLYGERTTPRADWNASILRLTTLVFEDDAFLHAAPPRSMFRARLRRRIDRSRNFESFFDFLGNCAVFRNLKDERIKFDNKETVYILGFQINNVEIEEEDHDSWPISTTVGCAWFYSVYCRFVLISRRTRSERTFIFLGLGGWITKFEVICVQSVCNTRKVNYTKPIFHRLRGIRRPSISKTKSFSTLLAGTYFDGSVNFILWKFYIKNKKVRTRKHRVS